MCVRIHAYIGTAVTSVQLSSFRETTVTGKQWEPENDGPWETNRRLPLPGSRPPGNTGAQAPVEPALNCYVSQSETAEPPQCVART